MILSGHEQASEQIWRSKKCKKISYEIALRKEAYLYGKKSTDKTLEHHTDAEFRDEVEF